MDGKVLDYSIDDTCLEDPSLEPMGREGDADGHFVI